MGSLSERNHAKFLRHLEASQEAVKCVASWLNGEGYAVRLPARSAALTASEWEAHADGGDLFLEQRIEVKQLSITFSDANDFPYTNIIVCNKNSWDRAKPRPYIYILCSNDLQYAALVNTRKTRKFWFVKNVLDPRYENHREDCYFCPADKIKFIKLKNEV